MESDSYFLPPLSLLPSEPCAHQHPRWLRPPLLARAFSTWLIAACRRGVRGGARCWGVGGNHKISGDCIWCCHFAGSLISSWCRVIELLLWRSVPLAVHYSKLCLISPHADSQRYLRERVEHSLPAARVLVKPARLLMFPCATFHLFPRDRRVTISRLPPRQVNMEAENRLGSAPEAVSCVTVPHKHAGRAERGRLAMLRFLAWSHLAGHRAPVR